MTTMAMHFFDLASTPSMPWKNGGGSTQELACWPPGADMNSFEWRVSLATVDRPGPFSAFPAIDRQIMLLGGDGLHLRGPGNRLRSRATTRWMARCWAAPPRTSTSCCGVACGMGLCRS